jgi:hypothetical protein
MIALLARAPPSGTRPKYTLSMKDAPPPYRMRNFTQRVDHFDFFHNQTFTQRYLRLCDL